MKELSERDRVWQSKVASLERKIGRRAEKQVKAALLPKRGGDEFRLHRFDTGRPEIGIYEIKLDGWRSFGAKGW
jgi:hypothetical protein